MEGTLTVCYIQACPPVIPLYILCTSVHYIITESLTSLTPEENFGKKSNVELSFYLRNIGS